MFWSVGPISLRQGSYKLAKQSSLIILRYHAKKFGRNYTQRSSTVQFLAAVFTPLFTEGLTTSAVMGDKYSKRKSSKAKPKDL